jgi:hypothetical protein
VMVPMMSMLFIGPQATLEPDHIDWQPWSF